MKLVLASVIPTLKLAPGGENGSSPQGANGWLVVQRKVTMPIKSVGNMGDGFPHDRTSIVAPRNAWARTHRRDDVAPWCLLDIYRRDDGDRLPRRTIIQVPEPEQRPAVPLSV